MTSCWSGTRRNEQHWSRGVLEYCGVDPWHKFIFPLLHHSVTPI